MGHSEETVDTVLALKEQEWTKPILSGGSYYIFLLRKKFPELNPSFDQVKEQVVFDYKMEKSQTLYSKLIEETLAAEKVEFFIENLK